MFAIDNIQILRFDELTPAQLYDVLYLRARIFVEQQGCPYLDLDYVDQKSIHCMLYDGEELVAYARVIPAGAQHHDVSIGRVVTSRPRNGYGRRIFKAAMEVAQREFKADRIEITSQTYIKRLYEGFGFRSVGEEFMLEFRPHITMVWESK